MTYSLIKKFLIYFYGFKHKIFGKYQYDSISRKFLDIIKNNALLSLQDYTRTLQNSIFNFSSEHPFINSYKSKILFNISPQKAAMEIRNFEIIKQKWLKQNSKFKSNYDYLPFEKVAGAIGNYSELFNYLNYRYNIENKNSKPKIIIADRKQITNPYLFKYFQNYIELIESPKYFNQMKFISEVNKVAIDVASLFNGKYYPHHFATNFVNQELKKTNDKKFKKFKISTDDYVHGYKNLKKFGITQKDWYVLFHIRDGKGDEYRNSNPETYIKAMKYVINKGGWAIRVGRFEKFKFPKITGLLDYSFSNIASDRMDIFLAATCKFCVATSSGFAPIPKYFGRPVLLTNCIPISAYLELDKNDIFLPKKFYHDKSNKLIEFKNNFSFPTNYFNSPVIFKKNNIKFSNNSEEDLKLATEEMFNLNSNSPKESFLNKNKLFKDKLQNDLKMDFEFPLSHECNFSESVINSYI